MNNFFKTFFAALLAFIAANILIGIVTLTIWSGVIASFSKPSKALLPDSVLKIDFAENITDSPRIPTFNVTSLSASGLEMLKSLSMLTVTDAIRSAKTDDNIKGIYINYVGPGNVGGIAQMEELRAALADFRTSGKFIVSYNANYSQGLYWLCSVSDKILINPEGMVDWRGLASQVMFYKGLIDRLGVDVQVIRHGAYKSAVEPYITDRMSPANRRQMETLVNSVWDAITSDVALARSISVAELQGFADRLAVDSPATAQRLGLVDGLAYEDEVKALLMKLVAGLPEDSEEMPDGELNVITLGEYAPLVKLGNAKITHNKVAIVYADGQIVDGEGGEDIVGSITTADQIARAREDKNVKAVVFRINSPGGSALASEVIWREVELLKAEKPLIVSMSNYAASGGYYIACPADSILADRTTLTGSIGVFGLFASAQKTLKEKVGITVDVAKTSPYADMGSMFRPLGKAEVDFLQKNVEETYSTFVNHVAEGRDMTFDEVDAIGQGRVWSGVDAKEIGLINSFGGLTDAIAAAAEKAEIADNYRVIEILEEEDEFTALVNQFFSAKVRAKNAVADQLGEGLKYYNAVREMLRENGVQARMPYDVTIY